MAEQKKVLPRAVTYLRFAVADATGQKAAHARHICQRRANELGAVIVAKYEDIGSGLTDDRKQLKWMLADLASAADITYVIVPDHPMVARDMRVYGRIVWKIEQAGARLIVATVPLDNYKDMRSNTLGVLHAVADWATTQPQPSITEKKGESSSPTTPKEVEDD